MVNRILPFDYLNRLSILLIPWDTIEKEKSILDYIDYKSKSIYRAITFCRKLHQKHYSIFL